MCQDDSTLRMWDADGRASVRVEEGAEKSGLAYNADKASGIDVDGESDFAEDHQGPKTILNMIKVDTEGFSMLSVQEDESKVMVIAGLSDSSVAIIDMTREVILHVYKGHTDLVRGALCLHEKGLLVTAGWDQSIRVWQLQGQKGALPSSSSKRLSLKGGQAEAVETRTYAERFPPYQPVSLKNDKGLGTLKKKAGDIDKDPRGVFRA